MLVYCEEKAEKTSVPASSKVLVSVRKKVEKTSAQVSFKMLVFTWGFVEFFINYRV